MDIRAVLQVVTAILVFGALSIYCYRLINTDMQDTDSPLLIMAAELVYGLLVMVVLCLLIVRYVLWLFGQSQPPIGHGEMRFYQAAAIFLLVGPAYQKVCALIARRKTAQ